MSTHPTVSSPSGKEDTAAHTSETEMAMHSREFLATLAARVMKEEDSPKEAISRAWRLIKEAENLLRGQILEDISIAKRRKAEQQNSKTFNAALLQITSKNRADRAKSAFKKFLRGGSKKNGVKLDKSIETLVKNYGAYKKDGITEAEIKKLKSLYEMAFPPNKKKLPSTPTSQITRKREIILGCPEVKEADKEG
jgi:hypothetical protein